MVRKARLLNPNHPDYYHTAFGMAAFVNRNYTEALEQLHKANLPEWLPHQAFLIATYARLQRDADARRQLGQLLRLQPELTLDSAGEFLSRMMPFQPDLVDTVTGALSDAGLEKT
jgi:hypothetical protein